jgi:YidC/Oxa1 family membrane protein insertase
MNNRTESPFGNPRFIFSIILVFIFLWGWQYYVNKTYPPQTAKPVVVANSSQGLVQPISPNSNVLSGGEKTVETGKIAASTTTQPEKTFQYEDENVKWDISSKGMAFSNYNLKKYLNKDKKAVIFGEVNKTLTTSVNDKEVVFDLNKISETQYVGKAFVDGSNVKRTLIFNKDTMSFDIETEFDVTPKNISFSIIDKKHQDSGGNFLMPSFDHQMFLYKDSEKIGTEYISALADTETLNVGKSLVSLASIGSQYFTQGFIDKSDILPNIAMTVQSGLAKLDVNYNLKDTKVTKINNKFFIGPKTVENLQKIDPLMPEVMDYGIFGFISKILLNLMKYLYGLFGNWGLAIIALTIIMRLLMLPFNIMSFKSARAMQRIQPQLQAVREKYKNDPMAVNRETMALMKQNNANPLSSCLPMLLQIPVFFALWKTIGSSIEIYQQPFFGWISDLSSHDPLFIFPVLMGITMYFQQKMTPTTMDPTQQKILNFMPIIFSVFMLSLPSGLTLYNFISSLFGVVQQYFLLKDNTKA